MMRGLPDIKKLKERVEYFNKWRGLEKMGTSPELRKSMQEADEELVRTYVLHKIFFTPGAA